MPHDKAKKVLLGMNRNVAMKSRLELIRLLAALVVVNAQDIDATVGGKIVLASMRIGGCLMEWGKWMKSCVWRGGVIFGV